MKFKNAIRSGTFVPLFLFGRRLLILFPVSGVVMTNNKAKKRYDTHTLVECAMMIALGTVLSLIKVYEAPFGGSVTLLSMAPVIFVSFRHGIRTGLVTGFVYSVLQLLLGISSVAWVPDFLGKFLCILLDYLLPFTMLGFGGMFRRCRFLGNERANAMLTAFLGTLAVTLFRFACHILSGVVIWYALDLVWYADDPTHIVNQYSSWIFSIIYNAGFMVPEVLETCIGVPLLIPALMRIKK